MLRSAVFYYGWHISAQRCRFVLSFTRREIAAWLIKKRGVDGLACCPGVHFPPRAAVQEVCNAIAAAVSCHGMSARGILDNMPRWHNGFVPAKASSNLMTQLREGLQKHFPKKFGVQVDASANRLDAVLGNVSKALDSFASAVQQHVRHMAMAKRGLTAKQACKRRRQEADEQCDAAESHGTAVMVASSRVVPGTAAKASSEGVGDLDGHWHTSRRQHAQAAEDLSWADLVEKRRAIGDLLLDIDEKMQNFHQARAAAPVTSVNRVSSLSSAAPQPPRQPLLFGAARHPEMPLAPQQPQGEKPGQRAARSAASQQLPQQEGPAHQRHARAQRRGSELWPALGEILGSYDYPRYLSHHNAIDLAGGNQFGDTTLALDDRQAPFLTKLPTDMALHQWYERTAALPPSGGGTCSMCKDHAGRAGAVALVVDAVFVQGQNGKTVMTGERVLRAKYACKSCAQEIGLRDLELCQPLA
jgi:hypothetical protein